MEMLNCNLMLGQIFMDRNDLKKAEEYLNHSISLYSKVKKTDKLMLKNIMGLNKILGDLFIQKNQLDNAYYCYIKEVENLTDTYLKENNEKAIEICMNLLDMIKEESDEIKKEYECIDI